MLKMDTSKVGLVLFLALHSTSPACCTSTDKHTYVTSTDTWTSSAPDLSKAALKARSVHQQNWSKNISSSKSGIILS